MSKEKLTTSEWELVRDAHYWVNQALAAADGRVAILTKFRENKAFDKAVKEYKSANALIKDIIADGSDAAKEIGKASQADAEKALNRIAAIVEQKLGANDLAALKDYLLSVGNAVASSAKEHGTGSAISEKESAALLKIESALKVSAAYATAHTVAKPAPAAAKPAPAKRDDDAREKAEAEAKAKKDAEAKARLEQAREEAEAKAKAKKDAESREKFEKARQEVEERQREAAAKAEAEAKAREEAAAAVAAAAAAPKYTKFIAEHTVQPGDNLSFISERYYGTQANFRIIYEANKDVIGDNMSLIRPGQVLKIPKL